MLILVLLLVGGFFFLGLEKLFGVRDPVVYVVSAFMAFIVGAGLLHSVRERVKVIFRR